MASKFWTEPKVKALARLYKSNWTYDQIARYFGVTKNAVSVAVSRHKISSYKAGAARRVRLHPPHTYNEEQREQRRIETTRRWQDPEQSARMRAGLIRTQTEPELIEKRAAKLRGYTMTPKERVDRDLMRLKHHMTAAEIRDALGK